MSDTITTTTTAYKEAPPCLPLVIEFTGGLELLFSNKRKHTIALPSQDESGQPANMEFLIQWLCKNLIKTRDQSMFVVDGSVRPGILVLINDADWELEGEKEYQLQKGDNVLFVSTLHGG